MLQRGYDRSADDYDERFRALQRVKYEIMLGEAEADLAARLTHGRVLDLGCGTGLAFELAGRADRPVRRGRWVGLDVSFNMLRHARRRGLPVIQGAAEGLPFREAAFDAVLAFTVLGIGRHPPGDALREVARVLAKTGFFVLTVLARDHHDRLGDVLAKAGLSPRSPQRCGQDVGYVCVRA